MQVKAEARYVRVSAQKARLVVDLIRGRKAGEAITILRTTNKRISPEVEKVLRSAIANAEDRFTDVDVDSLLVTEAYVMKGRARSGSGRRRWAGPIATSAGLRTSW